MNRDVFDKIIEDHRELSSLPQVLLEVIRVANDPGASAGDLAGIAMKDPGLTARLLRVANSSYYSPAREISSINQAVVTMGMRAVVAVALTSSIYNMVEGIETTIDRKRFWRHSLETALACRLLARSVDYEQAEEAFVAGLLHEIGLLVLEASFTDTYREIWSRVENGEPLVTVETACLGTDHARVGQFLLDQWRVPSAIGAAVGSHHNVFETGEKSEALKLNQIVCLGNHLSKFRAYDTGLPEAEILAAKRAVAGNLEVSNATLVEIESDLIAEVVRESNYLEIEVGSFEEILKEANHLLYKQYLFVENLLSAGVDTPVTPPDSSSEELDNHALEAIAMLAGHLGKIGDAIRNDALSLQSLVNTEKTGEMSTDVTRALKTVLDGIAVISEIKSEITRVIGRRAVFSPDKKLIEDIDNGLSRRIEKIAQHAGVSA